MDTGEPIPGATPIEAVKPKEPAKVDVGITAPIAAPTEIKPDIEQIKKELVDPRTISKKTDVEGRNETTRAILEARAGTRSTRDAIAEKEQKVQEIAELTSSSYQSERERTRALSERLEALVVNLKVLLA